MTDQVIRILPSAAAQRHTRQEVAALIAQVLEHLVATRAGDLVYLHGAHLALGRAVGIVLQHGLDVEGMAR